MEKKRVSSATYVSSKESSNLVFKISLATTKSWLFRESGRGSWSCLYASSLQMFTSNWFYTVPGLSKGLRQ